MRYWISWEEPTPDGDHRPMTTPVEPAVLHWWCSGYGEGYSTLCAVVDANTEDLAKVLVKVFWKPQAWRFVHEKPNDWMPPADRFPV